MRFNWDGQAGVDERRDSAENDPSRAGGVEGGLAQFAFIREDYEGEVRLTFRDVPADEIARAFRSSGAMLITLAGEWSGQPHPPAEGEAPDVQDGEGEHPAQKRRKRGKRPPASGEVRVRYFYSFETTIYTVIIAVTSGTIESVAGVYPGAALREREVQERLGIGVRQPAA